jgi:uncharacterized protein (TIGR03435 family)
MKHAMFLLASLAFAQSPTFEVASVKPAAPDSAASRMPAALPAAIQEQMRMSGGPGTKDPGRITYNGVTLNMLLKRAYDITPDQISGPDWLDSERYDIVAKIPPGATAEQFRLMLQNLLAERFELRQHRETKTLPVYLLTVAKNGPKLEPTETLPVYKDDEERKAAMQKRASENLAAMMAARQSGEPTYGRSFHLPNATMSRFIQNLAPNVDRPIKDKTQIEGLHSFSLKWTPESQMPAGDSPRGPSIYAALEEQLGLKLQPAKDEIELLVVDHAAKTPTAN